jgi:2-oxoglutarate ferredoxin oxidoreductase subunit gamma
MGQHEIVIAGFGGHGILSAGRLLAYAGMLENKNVSWLPSYGPEMRGGTAYCHVVISEEQIGSPILNSATALIAMNNPSLEKFENMVVEGGVIITDSSLADKSSKRKDVSVSEIPATNMALEMGNNSYAVIILLGKLIGKTGAVSEKSFELALRKVLPSKYHHMIPEEMDALKMGMNY